MNDKIEKPQLEKSETNEKQKFVRPDLTGETLGGIELSKKIGRGGFGDVYISPDHKSCVKVIFRGAFSSPESYERELNAVRCISSCVQRHCGIIKFFGGGSGEFNYREPFSPYYSDRTEDSEMYSKYPVIPGNMEWECQDWKDKKSQEFFFYLMLAADNLAKEPGYCPDTLENRWRLGRLEKMSERTKIRVIGEIIDSLLFLYNLKVENEFLSEFNQEREIFHITHGDLKPANIFFVNGHAQLGDMGATLQINPTELPLIGTPRFMLNEFERCELELKCGNDFFAYSVFSDIYALGKTARYMLQNGYEEDFSDRVSDLSMISDTLCSFHDDPDIRPENVVDKLKDFRHSCFPDKNLFGRQSCYGTPALAIELGNLYEFSRSWQIVEAESENRFLVTNHDFSWKGHADILLAERFPWDNEDEIRAKEPGMLRRGRIAGRPIMIYKLKCPRTLIVLSHRRAAISPSEEALQMLQREIARFNPPGDDPGLLF